MFRGTGNDDAIRTGEIDRKQAIEEVLRYRSPIQSLDRIALEDVELKGQQIQEGDVVTAWLVLLTVTRNSSMLPKSSVPSEDRIITSHSERVSTTVRALHSHESKRTSRSRDCSTIRNIEADPTDLQPLDSLYGLESLTCTIEE